MYLGIDLGTSNSTIVGNRAGKLELFKTVMGEDTLPSVLMKDRSGSLYVGKRAYEQMRVSPEGIAARFKRLLGTSSALPFGSDGETITPEEASAEVIRQLLTQARAKIGDEELVGTIVTVPAAFNQMQSEATIRAANAAGLNPVGLLQEPIAAAMACMENPDARNGLFLIYDLGGGTFDVALVRAINGAVTVEAHEGINMLGGSDFDRLLIEHVVTPWLQQNFTIPKDITRSPQLQQLMAIAKAHTERAKIELSTMQETTIFVSEAEAQARDVDGKPIYLDIPISRAQVEEIVGPQIERSIELCRKVLADHDYTAGDVTKVVLIGGPSRMPVVRERVPGDLGVDVDLDIDPMTAVARGAAIYAESREWKKADGTAHDHQDSSAGVKKSRVKQGAGDHIAFDFEARTTSERARIRVIGQEGTEDWSVTATSNKGEDYGTRGVAEKPIFSILLEPGETVVQMRVTDETGAPVEAASQALTLTRTMATATGAPCTATIAVKVEDTDGTRAINMLEPLLEKGEVLPKKGQRTFRAARKLEPGAADWIDVELYEKAPDVPEPEANLLIGSFRLSATDLPPHVAPLMPGDEVILHWAVDDSQLIRASVELPSCGLHLRDHSFYVDDLAKIDFSQDGDRFAREALLAAESDLDKLRQIAGNEYAHEITAIRRRLDEQAKRVSTSYEADVFRSVTEEARMIRQEISRLRHKPKVQATELAKRIYEAEQEMRRLSGTLDEVGMNEARAHLETAQRALDNQEFQVCSRAIKAAETVFTRYVVDSPGFIAAYYQQLRTMRHAAMDQGRYDQLIALGDAAYAAGDEAKLRSIAADLHNVIAPAGGGTANAAAAAGLRR
ncbi:MAG: Hsp70 family protein [Pseudomonadota bacterium]